MFSRKETSQVDQTEFVEDSMFLENKVRQKLSWQEVRKSKHLLPFYILVFFLFLGVVLLILRIVLNQQVEQSSGSQAEAEDVTLDPLNQEVEALRTELKDHDPTKQSLPFPQIDLEFNIN